MEILPSTNGQRASTVAAVVVVTLAIPVDCVVVDVSWEEGGCTKVFIVGGAASNRRPD